MAPAARQRTRILVTGATGFVGRHLLPRLADDLGRDGAVIGLGLGGAVPGSIAVDLTDAGALDAMVADARPTHVVHLAALSSVRNAGEAAAQTWATNVDGTVNLARAVRRHAAGALVVFASSAEIYGAAFAAGRAVSEGDPILPQNAYARSKAAAEFALIDHLSGSNPVIALRLFNHTGPGQDERFVVPSFAAQIARIERGAQEPVIWVGNLGAERDFVDVRDIVEAYRAVLAAADRPPGVQAFNVGSGRMRTIAGILDILVRRARVPVDVAVDPARLRPVDIPRALGDCAAFSRTFGWHASTPIETTLADVLDDWRHRVA